MLGQVKAKFVWVSKGILPAQMMMVVAERIIKAAGMTLARDGRVDWYPYKGGGGKGYTLYQPLMESYLIADVYTDLGETEILLSTCKPERIDLDQIHGILENNVGQTERIL